MENDVGGDRAAGCGSHEATALATNGERRGGGAPHYEPEETCTLTVTADVEDVCLLECVSLIVDHIGGSATPDDIVQALVGESGSSLVCLVPREALDELGVTDDKQRAYEAQRAAWRDEAEARCEPRLPRGPVKPAPLPYASIIDFSGSPEPIDHHVSGMSAALAGRDVIVGQLGGTRSSVPMAGAGSRRVGTDRPPGPLKPDSGSGGRRRWR
jgi:hypothetical protein